MKTIFRIAMKTLFVFWFAFCFSVQASAQESNADEVIESILAAYGGREVLSTVQSYRMYATLQAHTHQQTGEEVRNWEAPDHLQVFIRYPTRMELRIIQGLKAWRGSEPHALKEVSGMMRDAMILQLLRASVPHVLMRTSAHVRLIESTKSAITLELQTGTSLQFRMRVDPLTFQVVQTEGRLQAENRQITFQTRYSDFRKVDGVLFPFTEENYASGVHTASTHIIRLVLNPTDRRLKLPTGEEA